MILKKLFALLILSILVITVPISAAVSGNPTMGEKNAVKKAISYIEIMPFSQSGLVDQLEYDGFSKTEAVYGVEHIDVDWDEQAAKKAESYLNIMSFSKKGLIDQLVYDGFTREQAEYGVKSVGY